MRIGGSDYSDGGEGAKREAPATGLYKATVAKFWDVGVQPPRDPKDQPKRKVCLALELVSEALTGKEARDSKGRRFVLFKDFNASLFKAEGKPTAHLRAFLDAVLPEMAEKMLADTGDIDTTAWEGEGVLVQVENDGGKARCRSFMPWPTGNIPAALEGKYAEPFGLAKWLISKQVGK